MMLHRGKHEEVTCDGCTKEVTWGKTEEQAWDNAKELIAAGVGMGGTSYYYLCDVCMKDPEGAKAQQRARAKAAIAKMWPTN